MRQKGKSKKGKGTHGEAGFTLLEVLVALALLSIAITLIIQLYSTNLRSVSISGRMTAASVWSDVKLREILADPSLKENAWTEVTDDGYRTEVSVVEVLKERTDNLPVKMMEVTLLVRWNEGGRERNIRMKSMKLVDRMEPTQEGKNG